MCGVDWIDHNSMKTGNRVPTVRMNYSFDSPASNSMCLLVVPLIRIPCWSQAIDCNHEPDHKMFPLGELTGMKFLL